MNNNNNNSNNSNGRANGGARAVRARRAAPGVRPPALVSDFRSELHEAGLGAMQFFETMMNPTDTPPMRVPDAHSAMSAVFKTPFVKDLPFSGVWNPALGRTDTATVTVPDPTDGYSEVILAPGSTDSIFFTLGSEAIPWTPADTLLVVSHNMQMIPILATHPVISDIVGGRTQVVHGLRTYNTPGADDVCILPKLDDLGHSVFEVNLIPLDDGNPGSDDLEILLGFFNIGIEANCRTTAHLNVVWDSGLVESRSIEVSSTGDNNTAHSGFYIFQFKVTVIDDFVVSFFVEVEDVDSAAQWKFTLASTGGAGFGLTLTAKSACSFAVVDAPEMGELSETLSERTTALTGLLTYMGSTLQDGGQVSSARLGMGISPLRSPLGDVYNYLASLPFYNDNFALREGIYTWWLPDSIQEHFYVPYRNPRSDDLAQTAILQFSALRDNPNQAIRLQVIQNLEVITRSRLYAAQAGPNNPSYEIIIGIVKAIPAVTINKKHIGILGKAFNYVKNWVSQPKNWKQLLKVGSSIIDRLIPVFT